jgi:glycosyltransferase involved in cell wall biosynthesis
MAKIINCIDPCWLVDTLDNARTYNGNKNGGSYILYVGRLVRHKNVGILIEAFYRSELSKTHNLVICGHGPEKKRLRSLVRRRALTRHVEFLYLIDRIQMKDLMSGASCVFSASRNEGMPNALLEAAGVRVPIVASDIQAHRDLQELIPMLLFPEGDVSALARILEKRTWEHHPKRRLGSDGMGTGSMTFLKPDRLAAEYLSFFGQLKAGGHVYL